MNINTKEARDLRERYRQYFENNIRCAGCGNADWQQFIYVAAGDPTPPFGCVAGCKLCGRANTIEVTE